MRKPTSTADRGKRIMPTVVNCPACERKLKVPETLLGKKVKCPMCGTLSSAFTRLPDAKCCSLMKGSQP